MITVRETSVAIFGAWRLAHFDAGGLRFFENTVEAFWRSFFAAVIVLPFYAMLLQLRYETGAVGAGVARFAAVEMIAYVIAWLAFPLAMASVAAILDREERYLGYIVAYNWAAVLQNALYLPIAMIGVAGGMGAGSANAAVIASSKRVSRVALTSSTLGSFISVKGWRVALSIEVSMRRSRGVTKLIAAPVRPARPVRPTRWT